MNNLDKMPFEEALQELEATVHRLEEGDLTLEEAIAHYERGMRLARHCTDALDAAELQVQKLTLIDDRQQLGIFFEDEPPPTV